MHFKVVNFWLAYFAGWLELSKEKNGCLGYIVDYSTQLYKLYRDYNKPLKGSLLNNQYNAHTIHGTGNIYLLIYQKKSTIHEGRYTIPIGSLLNNQYLMKSKSLF